MYMEWWAWTLIGVAAATLGGFAVMLIKTVPIARRVYREQLVKTSPDKWGRVCSAPDNEEQVAMWEAGLVWGDAHAGVCTETAVVSEDGLHLVGQLFRFGGTRCVIILPGRCECLKYSYFYAEPWRRAGFNVLVVDGRAHGMSEGDRNTVGGMESRDALTWADWLTEQGMTEIWFHTICVGSVAAILAMGDPACPPEVKGLVADGCFTSFRETFRRHMIAEKRPRFPVLDLCMHYVRRDIGTDVRKTAPIRNVGRLRQRALFLFGERDVFSVPKMSQKLFDRCGSPDKKLVWFPEGSHSHLRLHDPERYDGAILAFVKGEERA